MEQIEVTAYDLMQMCRLCLSRNLTSIDIFQFSSELGEETADIIMQCAPVQITRQDKMPTYICQLCFTQLKNFHQFQLQAVQTDKTLHRYLQQLNDCHPQIKVEWIAEEPHDNLVNQNSSADIIAKCVPVKFGDELDYFYTKQKLPTGNDINEEICLKSEIKDEPMYDNSLIPTQCADDPLEMLFKGNGSEISGEDSKIDFGDGKIALDTSENLKFENSTTKKLSGPSEETFDTIKEVDSSLLNSVDCSNHSLNSLYNTNGRKIILENKKIEIDDLEIVKDVQCLPSNENRTEYLSERKNLNEKIHVGEKRYQCDLCKMCFTKSYSLKKHKLIHTGEKPYQCDVCKIFFRQLGNLNRHKLIHTEEKPYQCDICNIHFREISHLKKHKFIHAGEKPYQCDICKMCFTKSYSLKKHKFIHTGEKPFPCDICKMCFKHSSTLKKHILIHTGEKPHRCDICKMCFRYSGALNKHTLIHTGETPHECDICNMCFRDAGNLKKHYLIHTGEKPYQCDVCKQCFRLSSVLKNHKLIHTEEKPYTCSVCQMCFRNSCNLKRHNLVHTGEKPYQCDVCKMCFRDSSTLKNHNLIHTGEKPYQCDVCKQWFRLLGGLKKHKLIHTV